MIHHTNKRGHPMLQRSAKRTMRRMGGYDVHRSVQSDFTRASSDRVYDLILNHNVNVVFDVGANDGKFGSRLRSNGYKGRIISFEPTSLLYASLKNVATGDLLWETVQSTLGDYNGASEVAVPSAILYSDNELRSEFDVFNNESISTAKKEDTVVSRLDAILDTFVEDDDVCFLKIDTERFQQRVLDGADGVIHRIAGVLVETTIAQLYTSDVVIDEMIRTMHRHGFTLMSIELSLSTDKLQQAEHVDITFFRK